MININNIFHILGEKGYRSGLTQHHRKIIKLLP